MRLLTNLLKTQRAIPAEWLPPDSILIKITRASSIVEGGRPPVGKALTGFMSAAGAQDSFRHVRFPGAL